ncbi:MAG: hypothetical protein NTV34_02555 [Proteobacteria bacterium]|nr:hypothetical protein [Pseudomonadota bacterium]
MTDLKTFTDDDSDASSAVPNEIPDVWEENKVGRRNKARWGTYQYIVYDIAEEAKKNFPSVEDSSLVPAELRWVYFSLSNFDGSPDISRTTKNINERYYRTNFWEAKPDLNDVDSFFISHRGTSDANRIGSPHANSIIRVRMTGDLRPSGGAAPKTEDVLSFERVYGFRGELEESGKHFPCDFEIASVKGSSLLLVNHFRDVKNFPASRYASVVSKVLGENGWFSEISEGATGHSYYQLALTPSGRAMAVSFFQNIAILLDAAPGTAITEFKTIN